MHVIYVMYDWQIVELVCTCSLVYPSISLCGTSIIKCQRRRNYEYPTESLLQFASTIVHLCCPFTKRWNRFLKHYQNEWSIFAHALLRYLYELKFVSLVFGMFNSIGKNVKKDVFSRFIHIHYVRLCKCTFRRVLW